jgi:hypothetical protein
VSLQFYGKVSPDVSRICPLLSIEVSKEGVPKPARLADILKLPGAVVKDGSGSMISSGISQIVPCSLGALPEV